MIPRKKIRIVKKANKEKQVQQNRVSNNLKNNIQLKITTITPIHIGSGEVYEPTNFIIDSGYLYEFRDEDFFNALPAIKQKKFLQIIDSNTNDSFVRIHKFVKENRNIAKDISINKVLTTTGLQGKYSEVVGEIVQIEGSHGDYKQVFNEFEIQRIQRKQIKNRDKYIHIGYIPGSSLKGAISTAYQEFIYKKDGLKEIEKKFQAKGRNISNNIFKDFKVSDSIVKKINTKIGFALNKERFKYDDLNPQNNIKLYTYIEVIEPESEFMVDINYGSLPIKEILESCNRHYMPIFKSLLSNETNGVVEYTNEYLLDEFYDKYRHFKLKSNQYLIRIGKHSGARAVTIDGLRNIKSKLSKNQVENREDETTTWLFGEKSNSNSGLLPFGWVLVEITKEE